MTCRIRVSRAKKKKSAAIFIAEFTAFHGILECPFKERELQHLCLGCFVAQDKKQMHDLWNRTYTTKVRPSLLLGFHLCLEQMSSFPRGGSPLSHMPCATIQDVLCGLPLQQQILQGRCNWSYFHAHNTVQRNNTH